MDSSKTPETVKCLKQETIRRRIRMILRNIQSRLPCPFDVKTYKSQGNVTVLVYVSESEVSKTRKMHGNGLSKYYIQRKWFILGGLEFSCFR